MYFIGCNIECTILCDVCNLSFKEMRFMLGHPEPRECTLYIVISVIKDKGQCYVR